MRTCWGVNRLPILHTICYLFIQNSEQYRVSPQKSGMLDICYFEIRKYSIFISSDKTLASEQNNTKIIEIGWVVLLIWLFLIPSSLSIFSSFSWHFSRGLWLFWLPYIVAREPIDPCEQNKERTYGLLYPS